MTNEEHVLSPTIGLALQNKLACVLQMSFDIDALVSAFWDADTSEDDAIISCEDPGMCTQTYTCKACENCF
jgi:hypothetical protein